jgi:predicted DNA-binding transcriptional regulator YafY
VACDTHHGYLYYIANIDDFKNDRSRQWLLNSFCASNLVQAGEQIKERIVYEDIPESPEYLSSIIEAMKSSRKIEITYQSYQEETPSVHLLSPLCIKLFHQHWYLLADSKQRAARLHFALNRMQSLAVTDEQFVYPADDFSPEAFYQFYSGIYVDDNLPLKDVRLRTYDKLWCYLRALPLHQSQTEVANTDTYVDFKYTLRITPDFIQELLKRGKQIEVLEPESLRERMQKELQKALMLYKE